MGIRLIINLKDERQEMKLVENFRLREGGVLPLENGDVDVTREELGPRFGSSGGQAQSGSYLPESGRAVSPERGVV